MVPANDIYRDTSFMGGLLDFEFAETYLGLTGALNTVNPLGDTASRPHAALRPRRHRGRPRQRAGQLPRGARPRTSSAAAPRPTTAPTGRRATRRTCSRASPPTTSPPTWSAASSTSSRTASRVNYAELQNAWAAPQHHRADAVRAAHDRPLPADRRAVGAPQRLLGQRRPARAGVVRHVAQGREDRHGADADAAALLRPRQRRSSPRPRRIRSPARPRPACTSAPAGRSPARHRPAGRHARRRRSPACRCLCPSPRCPPPPATRSCGARAACPAAGRSTSGRWAACRSPRARPGFLAPCATDDRLAQAGPWATSYTSAPFTHATTLAGPVTATVYASATTSETQLVAELEEVTPDGTSYPLTEGALLGSLRAVEPEPVLDRRRHDRAALPPVHAGLGQAGQPRAR